MEALECVGSADALCNLLPVTTWILLAVSLLTLVAVLAMLFRRSGEAATASDALLARLDALRDEVRRLESGLREELAQGSATLREEVGSRLDRGFAATLERHDVARRDADSQLAAVRTTLEQNLNDSRAAVRAQLEEFQARARDATIANENALARHRSESADSGQALRSDLRERFGAFAQTVEKALAETRSGQAGQLNDFSQRLAQLQTAVSEQLDRTRQTLDSRLSELATQNAAKLDEMRQTVDQRLQATLEQRLGESFKLVGDNLERVLRGLGEMQQMAASVGDLKRVLTNVKSRGTWGEVQLAGLLENVLTAGQYAANVAPVPGSAERVEFAVRLPGREPGAAPVWLPIDAKFPVEDYERLAAAAERADAVEVAAAAKALSGRVYDQARTIAAKYVAPPHTTDFGILFLPTEGLYAEVLRQPGLADSIQRDHRVVVAGPTTLSALLNSLQMGFRTLAIEQRAGEVWRVLGAVKTEFGKFGDTLDRVQKRLEAATKEIEQSGVRSRAIERRLRDVEALPETEAAGLLPEGSARVALGDDSTSGLA
jgi:DNA recombination protein RmuC